jgi:hypothetical protein
MFPKREYASSPRTLFRKTKSWIWRFTGSMDRRFASLPMLAGVARLVSVIICRGGNSCTCGRDKPQWPIGSASQPLHSAVEQASPSLHRGGCRIIREQPLEVLQSRGLLKASFASAASALPLTSSNGWELFLNLIKHRAKDFDFATAEPGGLNEIS